MSGNWPFLRTDRYPPPQDWKAQTWVFFYRWALRILKFIHQDSLKRKVSLSWRKRSLLLHHLLLLLLLVCPNFTIPCSAFLPHPPPEHVVDSLFKIISSKNGDYDNDFKGQNMLGAALARHIQRGKRQFFTSGVGPAMASYSSGAMRQSLATRFQLCLVPMTMAFFKM